MIQFYAPDIASNPVLPEVDSGHCCRVLRMKPGDEIYVTDGCGSRFLCVIEKADPKATKVTVKNQELFEDLKGYSLTLAVAPTKNSDRLEWLVEKAVEIGVDKIVLLKCKRGERKYQKSERILKVMISAMKQSLAVWLPELAELTDFSEFIENASPESQKFFGYCSEAFPRKEFVKECQPGGNVIVMIGPEGDFSPEEVESAVERGFIPVTFGHKRLRTETAGVFAVSAVSVINQLSSTSQ